MTLQPIDVRPALFAGRRANQGRTVAASGWAGRVSLDLSSVTVVRQLGNDVVAHLLGLVRPEVVFATKEEASMVERPTAPTVVIKLDREGVLVNGKSYPAPSVTALGTTGAGDAFAAGYLVAGPELALTAAAKAVGQPGAMPAVRQELS